MTRALSSVVLLALTLTACSSDPTGPTVPTELSGLIESPARDSIGTPPPPPTNSGPGEIRGTVLTPSPGGGNDSLATAPRIEGAIITVYPVSSTGPLELDPEVASAVTGADGKFHLATLPAGEYVVTVEPPVSQADTYYGQWIRGTIHSGSAEHPWWIVLANR